MIHRHVHGGTGKTIINLRISCDPAGIRDECLLNTSLEIYRYTNPLDIIDHSKVLDSNLGHEDASLGGGYPYFSSISSRK
jgi:hypothetical protein